MSTKRIIADQVLIKLAKGYPNVQGSVQKEDIYKGLEQKINSKYRIRQLENLQTGETIPDGLCFATYTDIAVTADGDRSKSILPVMPISLTRNMGIFDIRHGDNSFIPLQPGQRSLLQTDSLLNNLLNQIGYTPNGKTILYTQNIALLGWDTVDMDLIVCDLSILSETDLLPIPASYEEELVLELYEQFSPTPKDKTMVNPIAADKLQEK